MNKFLSEIASIASLQFMIMMIIIALILIFHDSKNLKKKDATKDYKIAKGAGICYLILGIGLYVFGNFVA